MREIAALMGRFGRAMSTREIARELPEELRREAQERGLPLTPKRLGRRMEDRAQRGRYFEDLGRGRFQRLGAQGRLVG